MARAASLGSRGRSKPRRKLSVPEQPAWPVRMPIYRCATGGFFSLSMDTLVQIARPPYAWREYVTQTRFVARVWVVSHHRPIPNPSTAWPAQPGGKPMSFDVCDDFGRNAVENAKIGTCHDGSADARFRQPMPFVRWEPSTGFGIAIYAGVRYCFRHVSSQNRCRRRSALRCRRGVSTSAPDDARTSP